MNCEICNSGCLEKHCKSCKEKATFLAEKLLKAQARRKEGFITTDKLFYINRCIKETRRELIDPDARKKLHHWDELLNALISSGGEKAMNQLEIYRRQRVENSESF